MEYIIFEPHNLSESLKEDIKNLMAAMKNFVDINGGKMLLESFWWRDGRKIIFRGVHRIDRRHFQDEGELCEPTI